VGKRKSDFFPVIFLTLIVVISVVALTLTNGITKEKIALAKKEAISETLATLFPEMEDFTYDETDRIYTPIANGEPLGHAFMATATGYGGAIDILIGLEPDTTLRGIKIISQQETPGLGAKIVEGSFLSQFKGLSVDEVALSRDGGKVDAITGATISSSAVVEGVKEAILKKLETSNKEGGRD
jgi:electron transport complex protein RnfG